MYNPHADRCLYASWVPGFMQVAGVKLKIILSLGGCQSVAKNYEADDFSSALLINEVLKK